MLTGEHSDSMQMLSRYDMKTAPSPSCSSSSESHAGEAKPSRSSSKKAHSSYHNAARHDRFCCGAWASTIVSQSTAIPRSLVLMLEGYRIFQQSFEYLSMIR